MGSKYVDLVIGLFMAYFAYTRFMAGHNGFALLFLVLFILNVVTFTVKMRIEQAENKTNNE